ncbi:hypothetical protein A0H76_862 [Hepatospora eriocheir]|uniref:Uncharacterized protein n=1 Tax=Hepatospora eriocheir TaxID=1081669 RepID=A0A1X0QKY6_9MICR|nr:hypothetical protein A0H76_862 [Hepatospora eriocheir]
MIITEIRHFIEIGIVFLYMCNQMLKSKTGNKLTKYTLMIAVTSLIGNYIFSNYRNFSNTISILDNTFQVDSIIKTLKSISEILLISSVFIMNNTAICMAYGFFRIILFIYLDGLTKFSATLKLALQITYGIECIVIAFFLLINILMNRRLINNSKTISLTLVIYSLSTYLFRLFRLPFELTDFNLRLINTISQLSLLILYATMANSISSKGKVHDFTIKDPNSILEGEENKNQVVIDFSD